MHTNAALIACAVAVATGANAHAALMNGSFEDGSAWTLANDADMPVAGGAAGWAWETPITGIDVITSEDIFATDGASFAMTYAGGDFISQQVAVSQAGVYELSVDVNGVQGRYDSPIFPAPMVNGEFTLRIGNSLSDAYVAETQGGWSTVTFTAEIPAPGTYLIEIRNTLAASYAIAYDNVSLALIPAPGAAALAGLAGLGAIRRRR